MGLVPVGRLAYTRQALPALELNPASAPTSTCTSRFPAEDQNHDLERTVVLPDSDTGTADSGEIAPETPSG